MKILLVEDTDSLRCLFARILRGHGFEVFEASDGLMALDCLAHFRPDLVVTDLMMPELDGVGLIRRLRRMPDTEAIPVVAMTSVPTSETEREARRAGAVDFLAKPIDSGMLLNCVGSFC